MFDVLKTLSGLVKTRKAKKPAPPKKAVSQQEPQTPKMVKPAASSAVAPSVDLQAAMKLAEAQARELILEAKDEALRLKRDAEDEGRRKLEVIDRREGALQEREKHLSSLEAQITQKLADIEALKLDQLSKLEKTAHLTRDEAKDLVLSEVKAKLAAEIAQEIKQAQEEAKETADAKAKEILVDAMRHGATDYVPEFTVSVIKITDEDMKGRIIGKEGRNIRAFETATGVDVDLDEEQPRQQEITSKKICKNLEE